MNLTYRQARAILFSLSTLSLLTSFMLVFLMPNVDDIKSSHEETITSTDDMIAMHLKNYEVGSKSGIDNRHASRHRRERQQRDAYLPNELQEIMEKQQELHIQNNNNNGDNNGMNNGLDDDLVLIHMKNNRKVDTIQDDTEHKIMQKDVLLPHQDTSKTEPKIDTQPPALTTEEQLRKEKEIEKLEMFLLGDEDGKNKNVEIHDYPPQRDLILRPQNQSHFSRQRLKEYLHLDIKSHNNEEAAKKEVEEENAIHGLADALSGLSSTKVEQKNQEQQIRSKLNAAVTTGSAKVATAGLFVLFADSRSGADWIMNTLNEHPSICSSIIGTENEKTVTSDGQKVLVGGFPTGALRPSGMDWLDDTSIVKSCSLAFIQQQIPKMIRHMSATTEGYSMPRSCKEINPSNPLYPNHILERLCQFILRLRGNYTKAAISEKYIDSFVQSTVYNPKDHLILDFGCICPPGTIVRGLKIMSDWADTLPLFNITALHGSKFIRLHRRNLFARYMSLKIGYETNIWHIKDSDAKLEQLQAFEKKHGKFHIPIDELIHNFHFLQEQATTADRIAVEHGTSILNIDYDECRDNPKTCFESIMSFLDVDIGKIPSSLLQHAAESQKYAQYNSGIKALESYVTNKDVVKEVLIAHGWGEFLGTKDSYAIGGGSVNRGSEGSSVSDGSGNSIHQNDNLGDGSNTEIQHIIYGNDALIRKSRQTHVGITTKYVKYTRIDDSKFTALIQALQMIQPQALVVVTTGQGISISNHIRSHTELFECIANFRNVFMQLTNKARSQMSSSRGGPVVVAADSRCCSTALTHASPGDFFNKDGKRMNRSCSIFDPFSGKKLSSVCSWVGDQYALPWQLFMKELALDRSDSPSPTSNVYLDATLLTGKARDLLELFRETDILHSEDEHAILTDFMHYDPNRIVLDYDQKIFGRAFEGVRSKVTIHSGCVGNGESFDFDDDEEGYVSASNKHVHPLFLSNRRDLGCTKQIFSSVDAIAMKTYPVWDENGIRIQPIMTHIDRFFIQGVSLQGIMKAFGTEVLYVIDKDTIWISHRRQDVSRSHPTNNFIKLAHQVLKDSSGETDRWSALQRTVETVGFPYWAWYGDFKGCNLHNFGSESVPLFTTCARTDCKFAFPSPTFATITDAQADTSSWYSYFQKFDVDYSWDKKVRKAVWRGSLTGDDPSKVFMHIRWRLVKMVHEHNLPQFDVGFTEISSVLRERSTIDTSLVGGIKAMIKPMHSLQRYAAIIDMDGASWSSQFSTLLCYNSVIIKIEPEYIDYFHYDLKPWKHYIPVKHDLSDLVTNVDFVMDPSNDAIVKDIISSANQFCAERFVTQRLVHDMLDIWEYYIEGLDADNPKWKQLWLEKKTSILSSKLYDLVKLESQLT